MISIFQTTGPNDSPSQCLHTYHFPSWQIKTSYLFNTYICNKYVNRQDKYEAISVPKLYVIWRYWWYEDNVLRIFELQNKWSVSHSRYQIPTRRVLDLYWTEQWVGLRVCLSTMEQKNPKNSAKNPSKKSQILLQWWATVTLMSIETIINCI
jgi:hypothetical protein